MDLKLNESSVLITGSSSGIGKAAAIAFGAEGARIGVTYHANRGGAEETATKVREAGGQALVLHYDPADPDSIRSSIESMAKEWGTLSVLVNNAAPMEVSGPTGQSFEDVPLKNWEEIALANPGQEYLVLQFDDANPFSVTLTAGTYAAEWFNVNLRETTSAEEVKVQNDGEVRFMAPFSEAGPAVLYLKR